MYPEKGFDWDRLTGGKGQRWLQSEGSPLGPGPLGAKYAAWLEKKRKGAYEEIYSERRAQETYKKIGVMDMPVSNDEYIENWIAEESIGFIKERSAKEEPFFLWCGFCGPHGPFDPPEPYRSMYDPKDVILPVEHSGWSSWRDRYDEDLMRRCIAYYWGMITCIDDHIGRMTDELKELGIYDDTMILFVSDHGEMLGEKGLMGKCVFYDTVARVPMWIKPPSDLEYKSRTFDGLVEAMSVAPTILDMAGVEIPENMTAKSLSPILSGATDEGAEMIFSEYVKNDKSEVSKCVRTETHKYIRFFKSGKEEFYDLQNDPQEQDNLALSGAQKEKMLELKENLFDWLARTEWRQKAK
jgi:arylsulfatase A-like enzyme